MGGLEASDALLGPKSRWLTPPPGMTNDWAPIPGFRPSEPNADRPHQMLSGLQAGPHPSSGERDGNARRRGTGFYQSSALRAEPTLLRRLAAARARTDDLFGIVRPEAFYDRPIPERHRIIFYVGHLEAFDWNLLGRRHFDLPAFDAALDQLVRVSASIRWAAACRTTHRGLAVPRASGRVQSRAFATRSDERLWRSLNPRAERAAETAQLLEVAIEHRLMHAETSGLHAAPIAAEPESSRSTGSACACCAAGDRRAWCEFLREWPHWECVEARTRRQSVAHRAGFGWDNEFEEHRVAVPEFQIDAYKVTNGEFLKFMSSGGYQERSLWEDARLELAAIERRCAPVFLGVSRRTAISAHDVRRDSAAVGLAGVCEPRRSGGVRAVGRQGVAERSGMASRGLRTVARKESERAFPWGDQAPKPGRGNFDFLRWDPAPVAAFPGGRQRFWRGRPSRQRMGMDAHGLCAVSRL